MMKQKKNNGQEPDSDYHVPVLLKETVELLNIKADGVYVDCTFGGGGHSRSILEKLGPEGRLIAFDQDEDARRNLPDDPRVLFIAQNFRHLQRFLRLHGITEVDGILADLGISSHQIDEPTRGFSTRYNAALDMRMDQRQQKTAAHVVNSYGEQQLQKIFEQYGEVTNAKTLAKTLVQARRVKRLETIDDLKAAISNVVKGNPNKYWAQVFQALRIEVNDEMGALKELLQQVPGLLKPGGRVAILTFHSVEDRLAKIFFRDNSFDLPEETPFATSERKKLLRPVNKKPISPSAEELKQNRRARSARLRVAEKQAN